jgi:anti-sigma28 factor (negative regulator of flagellin synthesis)
VIRFQDFAFSEQLAKVIAGITGRRPAEIISLELQRIKKLRRIYIGTGLLLLSLLILAVFLYLGQRTANTNLRKEKTRSDSLRTVAVAQKNEALQNLKRFKVEEYSRNVRNGKIYMDAEEFALAKGVLDQAVGTIRDTLCAAEPEIVKSKDEVLRLQVVCAAKITK